MSVGKNDDSGFNELVNVSNESGDRSTENPKTEKRPSKSRPEAGDNDRSVETHVNITHGRRQYSKLEASNPTVTGWQQDICRICHCDDLAEPFITVCHCSGSLKSVHQSCIQRWVAYSCKQVCELCNYEFVIRKTLKPRSMWKVPAFTQKERNQFLYIPIVHGCILCCVLMLLFMVGKNRNRTIRDGQEIEEDPRLAAVGDYILQVLSIMCVLSYSIVQANVVKKVMLKMYIENTDFVIHPIAKHESAVLHSSDAKSLFRQMMGGVGRGLASFRQTNAFRLASGGLNRVVQDGVIGNEHSPPPGQQTDVVIEMMELQRQTHV